MRVSPVLRATSSLLSRQTSMSFCINKAMLDPTKHIYMNHVPHNVYVDYWPMGQYPDLHLLGSVASAAYQPQVTSILLETINSRYNVKLTEADILEQRWDHLFAYSIQTNESKNQFLEALLRKLATGVIVKESRWTWVKEQQVRLNMGGSLVLEQKPETVKQFLEAYNNVLEQLIVFSHFGFSRQVPQAETPQERHYYEELNNIATGIPDLEESRDENKGFINRLMRVLHTR